MQVDCVCEKCGRTWTAAAFGAAELCPWCRVTELEAKNAMAVETVRLIDAIGQIHIRRWSDGTYTIQVWHHDDLAMLLPPKTVDGPTLLAALRAAAEAKQEAAHES